MIRKSNFLHMKAAGHAENSHSLLLGCSAGAGDHKFEVYRVWICDSNSFPAHSAIFQD